MVIFRYSNGSVIFKSYLQLKLNNKRMMQNFCKVLELSFSAGCTFSTLLLIFKRCSFPASSPEVRGDVAENFFFIWIHCEFIWIFQHPSVCLVWMIKGACSKSFCFCCACWRWETPLRPGGSGWHSGITPLQVRYKSVIGPYSKRYSFEFHLIFIRPPFVLYQPSP